MTRADRRQALQLALAAAIAPAVCSARANAIAPVRLVAPPSTPMRYTRTVVRQMPGNLSLSVGREFAVTFRRFESGFMLEGQQTGVQVDAPANVAELVRLEEARDESDLFPITLDPFGQILSSRIARPSGQDLHQAVEQALGDLATQPIDQDERAQLSRFVATLQQAGQQVIAHLPTDLFAPEANQRRDERDIALPGGIEGRVETVFESRSDPETGLMREAQRNVITSVADSRRGTLESWSLTAI